MPEMLFPKADSTKRARDWQIIPCTPRRRKAQKTNDSLSPGQSSITAYFSQSPSQRQNGSAATDEDDTVLPVLSAVEDSTSEDAPSSVSYSYLHISDTKTRTSPGLPPGEDTLPARLQLMLYYRLLFNVLTAAPRYFEDIWVRASVSPREEFSAKFVQDAQLDTLGAPGSVRTLNDLVRVWFNSVNALHVHGIDPVLTVEYRSQRKMRRSDKAKRKGKERAVDVVHGRTSPVDAEKSEDADGKDSGRADGGSTRKSSPGSDNDTCSSAGSGFSTDRKLSPGADDGGDSVDVPLQEAIYRSLAETTAASKETSDERGSSPSDSEDTDTEAAQDRWRVVGTKSFQYDDQFLENYLVSVLAYWHGQRAPIGVDVELTRRCG